MRFALALLDAFPDFKAHKSALNPKDDIPPAVESFRAIEAAAANEDPVWTYAAFDECFAYLRGSTHLHIPAAWRGLIPSSIGPQK